MEPELFEFEGQQLYLKNVRCGIDLIHRLMSMHQALGRDCVVYVMMKENQVFAYKVEVASKSVVADMDLSTNESIDKRIINDKLNYIG